MKKLFLALWPDSETRRNLVKLCAQLNPSACKVVASTDIHVTLVFIGSVADALLPEIQTRVADIIGQPFIVRFDRLSYWRKPKIVCLTSDNPPDALMQLASELKSAVSACAIATEERAYKPHVTLARHALEKPELNFEPVSWCADSFCLVESTANADGTRYVVRQSWSF